MSSSVYKNVAWLACAACLEDALTVAATEKIHPSTRFALLRLLAAPRERLGWTVSVISRGQAGSRESRVQVCARANENESISASALELLDREHAVMGLHKHRIGWLEMAVPPQIQDKGICA